MIIFALLTLRPLIPILNKEIIGNVPCQLKKLGFGFVKGLSLNGPYMYTCIGPIYIIDKMYDFDQDTSLMRLLSDL